MNTRLALINKHLQAENRHDLEETLATLHPECVFEDIALGRTYNGHGGAAEYYRQWWGAFDLVVSSEQRHWSEQGMIAEARFTGTHVGTYLDHPASGRKIDFRLVVIIGFRDGLMSGERFYYDRATFIRQIEDR